MARAILPGKPYRQCATWDGIGVNFSIYGEDATGVELCLFDDPKGETCRTIAIRESTGHVWHCYVPGIRLGQYYGFRINGPYDPERRLRFNPAKLLIDPYAKALAGSVDWNAPVFGYELGKPEEDLQPDQRDDATAVPKGGLPFPASIGRAIGRHSRPSMIRWSIGSLEGPHCPASTSTGGDSRDLCSTHTSLGPQLSQETVPRSARRPPTAYADQL